jgi:hypothetical protein
MNKRIYLIILLLTCRICDAQNQGITNWWVLGYESYWGAPFGHTTFDFFSGAPVISPDSLEMDFERTAANISDSLGNLLFYTNGYYIADATGDTMQNGNNISPTGFYALWHEGLTIPQACLIIPKPGASNIYYLFHSTVDNAPNYNKAFQLYTSTIDMTLNGGLGAVINKNSILLQDTLNPGKITACRHANGFDWWVIVQRVNSNIYYEFLVTSTGISSPIVQNIGTPRTNWLGMACFSPDGTKYATFHAEYTTTGGLDVLDFNRCSGMLSSPIHITIPQTTSFSAGLAFSANSRFLYVDNVDSVYQYDMASANIATSKLTVAVWDSFYSPFPPFATLFEIPQLAPDGKIYISTGNGTLHIHVINDPDSLGLACNLVQHAIQFQHYYSNGIPNHPNYFLGCDTTGGCTCLVGISNPSGETFVSARASPNPNNGVFTLQFPAQKISGELKIYDILGMVVYKENISQWSQYKHLDITQLHDGIYLCKMKWGNTVSGNIKIVKD